MKIGTEGWVITHRQVLHQRSKAKYANCQRNLSNATVHSNSKGKWNIPVSFKEIEAIKAPTVNRVVDTGLSITICPKATVDLRVHRIYRSSMSTCES